MTVNCEFSTPIHPLTGQPRRPNGHARQDLFQLQAQPARRRREIHATYDAARTTDEFKNYWANADSLDADSANSRTVRSTLVKRSRYEVANNGYADGMVQTHANYLVGKGPSLRLQTSSAAFNTAVETQWHLWAKATLLRRKLWCMAHAKVQDGEPFGNSKLHYVWIAYNGTLEVRINDTANVWPAAQTLSCNVSIPVILGQSQAFVSFTSATCAAFGRP